MAAIISILAAGCAIGSTTTRCATPGGLHPDRPAPFRPRRPSAPVNQRWPCWWVKRWVDRESSGIPRRDARSRCSSAIRRVWHDLVPRHRDHALSVKAVLLWAHDDATRSPVHHSTLALHPSRSTRLRIGQQRPGGHCLRSGAGHSDRVREMVTQRLDDDPVPLQTWASRTPTGADCRSRHQPHRRKGSSTVPWCAVLPLRSHATPRSLRGWSD